MDEIESDHPLGAKFARDTMENNGVDETIRKNLDLV